MSDKYKTIIAEDECAPDASAYFDVAFEKKTGMTKKEWREASERTDDLGDTFRYWIGDRFLENEIGLYSLKEVIK